MVPDYRISCKGSTEKYKVSLRVRYTPYSQYTRNRVPSVHTFIHSFNMLDNVLSTGDIIMNKRN